MRRSDGSRLVAVWPGIGQVALTAGFYLMSKLHMHEEKPPKTTDLFDLDHLDVERGLARVSPIPEDHLFGFLDARTQARLSLMIGEAQPASHGLEYCRRILDRAEKLGVAQVITFAAVAADSHPRDPSRVLGVATQVQGLESLRQHGIETLEAGQIMGMNGLFLAAAAERGISGLCLMGVMPALATSIPYPKASHAVLSAFSRLTDVRIDLGELEEYGQLISQKLSTGLDQLREALKGVQGVQSPEPAPPEFGSETAEEANEPMVGPVERGRIEILFQESSENASKAFELKRELDRLGIFKEYENRFLDLFRTRR